MARYRIVPERSHVWIDARSNVHPIHSTTDGVEGFVDLSFDAGGELDPNATQSAKLTLPVSRLSSGNRMEDRELQKRIDARRFPTIEGVLDRLERSGSDGDYLVAGNITFRGVARRYEHLMSIEVVDEGTLQLAGTSRFDIRDFGMEPPRILMLRVEPDVDVRVEIVAEKEG